MKPAPKLSKKVDSSLHTANSQPIVETLRKKISGSMDGEASQKDITGAIGTPLISKADMIGITPQEQKGLKAPTSVAAKIAMTGLPVRALFMYLDAPDSFTPTAMGIVMSK